MLVSYFIDVFLLSVTKHVTKNRQRSSVTKKKLNCCNRNLLYDKLKLGFIFSAQIKSSVLVVQKKIIIS